MGHDWERTGVATRLADLVVVPNKTESGANKRHDWEWRGVAANRMGRASLGAFRSTTEESPRLSGFMCAVNGEHPIRLLYPLNRVRRAYVPRLGVERG